MKSFLLCVSVVLGCCSVNAFADTQIPSGQSASEKNVSAANTWLWPVAKVCPFKKAASLRRASEPEISCLMLRQPGTCRNVPGACKCR